MRQLDEPKLKAAKVRFDEEGRVESVLINLQEQEPMKPEPEEEGPLNLDDVARLLAGPPRRSLLRTNTYRVTRVKVRLVRPAKGEPPFRYVPKEKGHAVQVVLPMVGLMTSLDVKEGEPMDVWPAPPAPAEEAD